MWEGVNNLHSLLICTLNCFMMIAGIGCSLLIPFTPWLHIPCTLWKRCPMLSPLSVLAASSLFPAHSGIAAVCLSIICYLLTSPSVSWCLRCLFPATLGVSVTLALHLLKFLLCILSVSFSITVSLLVSFSALCCSFPGFCCF